MKTARIISPVTKKNLYSLLETMDKKTKTTYTPNGCGFTTSYTTGGILKGSKNGVFGGNICPRLENYPAAGTTIVRLNDKEYTIDNLTSQVKQNGFSLFKVSKKTLKAISELINKLKENFENPDIVEQHNWGISGFTKKGVERLQANQKKFYEDVRSGKIKIDSNNL